MNILLTGGAGYIGSHTYVALLEAGYTPVILDNFANSQPEVLNRLERITGQPVICERGDVQDRPFVEAVLRRHDIGAVLHFAARISVAESVEQPALYYRENFGETLALAETALACGIGAFVLSSTAAVYGNGDGRPLDRPRRHPQAHAAGQHRCRHRHAGALVFQSEGSPNLGSAFHVRQRKRSLCRARWCFV